MLDSDDRPESALVQHALHEPDAFIELYRLYVHRVYRYVASRVDRPQDAEDITADVFVRAVKHLDQVRNQQPGSFAAWLFSISRNVLADYYRRNGRGVQEMSLNAAASLAATEPTPDHLVLVHDEAARLTDLVRALPERKREIVTLRYYGDLRNHEIAAVLGIGEKTVSAYLSRALADLQAAYHDDGGHGEQAGTAAIHSNELRKTR